MSQQEGSLDWWISVDQEKHVILPPFMSMPWTPFGDLTLLVLFQKQMGEESSSRFFINKTDRCKVLYYLQ